MDIRISGHQLETGDALKTRVEDRLQAIADKYFSRTISSQVTFGRGPHDSLTCDIIAHVMQGVILKARGQAQEAAAAFEVAAEKIDKQLRRHSRKLKSRSGAAPASIDEIDLNAGYTVFDGEDHDDGEDVGDAPLIIAETRVDIPTATVSDAVMMLDLRNTTALLFVNTASGAHNMVYRRPDGSIGWVEPKRG